MRTSSWMRPFNLQGVRKGERRQSQNRVGYEGGAALERAWAWMLHWGLVFWWKTVAELGQLQQQWQQERPRTRPDHEERKSSEGGRDKQPWGSRTLTHSHFCERISQTEEEGKQWTIRNWTNSCKIQGKPFKLFLVPLTLSKSTCRMVNNVSDRVR